MPRDNLHNILAIPFCRHLDVALSNSRPCRRCVRLEKIVGKCWAVPSETTVWHHCSSERGRHMHTNNVNNVKKKKKKKQNKWCVTTTIATHDCSLSKNGTCTARMAHNCAYLQWHNTHESPTTILSTTTLSLHGRKLLLGNGLFKHQLHKCLHINTKQVKHEINEKRQRSETEEQQRGERRRVKTHRQLCTTRHITRQLHHLSRQNRKVFQRQLVQQTAHIKMFMPTKQNKTYTLLT